MPAFQGSGFSIELPDGAADASAYTFLLPMPEHGKFAPFITIQTGNLEAKTLADHVKAIQEMAKSNLEGFRVHQFKAGRHAGMEVVLTTVEWGPPAARLSETQAYYLVETDNRKKVFGVKGTDMTANFSNSQPVFNSAFRTFMPNELQLLADPS